MTTRHGAHRIAVVARDNAGTTMVACMAVAVLVGAGIGKVTGAPGESPRATAAAEQPSSSAAERDTRLRVRGQRFSREEDSRRGGRARHEGARDDAAAPAAGAPTIAAATGALRQPTPSKPTRAPAQHDPSESSSPTTSPKPSPTPSDEPGPLGNLLEGLQELQ